jgi:hypothetical protein
VLTAVGVPTLGALVSEDPVIGALAGFGLVALLALGFALVRGPYEQRDVLRTELVDLQAERALPLLKVQALGFGPIDRSAPLVVRVTNKGDAPVRLAPVITDLSGATVPQLSDRVGEEPSYVARWREQPETDAYTLGRDRFTDLVIAEIAVEHGRASIHFHQRGIAVDATEFPVPYDRRGDPQMTPGQPPPASAQEVGLFFVLKLYDEISGTWVFHERYRAWAERYFPVLWGPYSENDSGWQ